MDVKQLIARVRRIIAEPKFEFAAISKENNRKTTVFLQFILPLLILYALTTFIGNVLFGPMSIRDGSGIVFKRVVHIILVQITTIYVSAIIIDKLLPLFQAAKDSRNVFSLVAFSFTPVYLSIILAGLLPGLSKIIYLLGFYSIVLFWIGTKSLIPMTLERRQLFVTLALLIIIFILPRY